MKSIKKDPNLKLIPIITGMHLLNDFGETQNIVKDDFPEAIAIPMILQGDELKDMAYYLSSGIKNFTDFFSKKTTDIVVVLGDRTEALAAALSALYLNIPIAHIDGGDVSGTTIDESIRHAITKIAHIHFAHTKTTAKRLKKMGENPARIFLTGALTLDTILHTKLKPKKEIFKKYKLDPNKTTLLVVQHPITTLRDRGYSEIKQLLETLDTLQMQTILIYPNCDAGGKKFIDLIEKFSKKSYIFPFKNLPHEDYISLMKSVNLMIGNSSSGIIESPSLKIPVINIGSRQQGRERSENILDIKPDKNQILQAINRALYDKNFLNKVKTCKNRFGDGYAASRMVKTLKEITLNEKLIQKQITY